MARLKSHAAEFESHYGWTSEEFYPRFERGELGDAMDLIEWSATVEMIRNLQTDVHAPAAAQSRTKMWRSTLSAAESKGFVVSLRRELSRTLSRTVRNGRPGKAASFG